MNKQLIESNRKKFFELTASLSLLLVYPVSSIFWHHGYPIASPDFLISVTAIILFSAALAAILSKVRSLITNLAFVLFTAIILMIQFNLLLEGLLLTLLISTTVALITKQKFPKLLIPILLAAIVGAYLDTLSDRAVNKAITTTENPNASLPPIVHIVLDEFIGLDGLPPQQPAQMFREKALDFFSENGFQIYPKAYSNYLNTEDSLGRAFNFDNGNQKNSDFGFLLHRDFDFKSNAYLDSIQELGYAIRIYQSEGMGFCKSIERGPEKCWTYPIPDLISIYRGYENPFERIGIILRLMVSQSRILNAVSERQGWIRPGGFSYFKPEIFEEISGDIMGNPNGRMFFAHVLFPHSPYVYVGDCSLNYKVDRDWRFATYTNTPETRGIRYILYLEQARCALNQLDQFFNALREGGIYDKSIILLHGDHGSRIFETMPNINNETKLIDNDFLDGYSTLFAVKMPNDNFFIHQKPVSLSVLIQQFTSEVTGIDIPEPDTKPFIYLPGPQSLERRDIDIFSDMEH